MIYTTLKNHVIAIIQRRSMYVSDRSYNGLRSYIEGCLAGIEIVTGINLHTEFQKWFWRKLKKNERSLGCASYIYEYIAHKNDQEASELLLKLLVEFAEQHEAHS